MTLLKAIIMGLVQGIAEFLPISSSGHLALFKQILDIDLESGGMVFDVLLHLGTLLAIFIVFFKDIRQLVVEGFCILGNLFYNAFFGLANLFQKEKKPLKEILSTPYRRFVMLIIVSTIPTGILGIVLKDVVELASTTILIPGICLIITAVLLLIADNYRGHGKKQEKNATFLEAAIIGTSQGIATMPGLSRSGTTITACLLCGFEKNFAVRYSFIMSIPAVLGAVVLELKDFDPGSVATSELGYYAIGTIVAAAVGYLCIKTMLVVVRKKKYRYFAYYCLVVGLVAIFWNFF